MVPGLTIPGLARDAGGALRTSVGVCETFAWRAVCDEALLDQVGEIFLDLLDERLRVRNPVGFRIKQSYQLLLFFRDDGIGNLVDVRTGSFGREELRTADLVSMDSRSSVCVCRVNLPSLPRQPRERAERPADPRRKLKKQNHGYHEKLGLRVFSP